VREQPPQWGCAEGLPRGRKVTRLRVWTAGVPHTRRRESSQVFGSFTSPSVQVGAFIVVMLALHATLVVALIALGS
jgi:hypothetical protein